MSTCVDLSCCKTILLFGGSFDPPHLGHLRLPMLAMEAVKADAVAYLPAGVSPLKNQPMASSGDHRLNMLRLALAGIDQAVILADELDADASADCAPSYTVDTLAALGQRLAKHVTLRLLIGADQLLQFDRWHDWQWVVQLAEPVVMLRPPQTRVSLLDSLPGGFDRRTWASRLVDLPTMDISSTAIRQSIAHTQSVQAIKQHLHPDVAGYIRAHRLYGGA